MNMEKLRKKAIKRYLNGESPKEIYQSLGKGKTWFFKWLKRQKLDGANWAKEHSRKPHQSPKKIDRETEQMVIATRKKLENKLYAQIGALAISYDLENRGIAAPPISTINKILSRGQLIHQKKRYVPKGVDYPSPIVTRSNDLYLLDVMGPRYLKTDGRFVYIWEYSLSLFPSENPGVMELLNVFNMTLIGYFFEVSILMTFWICMKNPGSLNSFITAATWED